MMTTAVPAHATLGEITQALKNVWGKLRKPLIFMITKPRILVIWDDLDIRGMFKFALENIGYDVLLTHSFSEGFLHCLQQQPDLVIFPCYNIDSENGLDFCRKLRANNKTKQLPIIVGNVDHMPSKWKEAYQPVFDVGANACFGRVADIADVIEQVGILVSDPTVMNLPDNQSLKFS